MIKRFEVFLLYINNFIYQVFLSNMKNLLIAVYQLAIDNNP